MLTYTHRNTFHELEALARSGFRAGTIYADVPLRYDTWSSKGRDRCADRHYLTMTEDELIAMKPLILALAAKKCALYFWTSGALLQKSKRIITGWNFTYSTIGFAWVKTLKGCTKSDLNELTDNDLWAGNGYDTRAGSEFVIYARRKSPPRLNANVKQVVVAPQGRHSEKPEEVARRIEQLRSGPYLELFARRQRPGWVCWGDELPPLIPAATEAAE
jgi:N6-adenosine-specific RNA methylase IME4